MSLVSTLGSRKSANVLFLASLWIALVAFLSGCQIDVSGAVGAKAFYPNKLGKDRDIGDPRTGMYDGSGYGERHTAGSENGQSGAEHFQGLKAEKGGE